MSISENLAKIGVNKCVVKEYNTHECDRTVYLNNGDEFQIQIFNPYEWAIGAKITINNKKLSNRLIIKPGQRIWLERYLDSPNKFKFNTYEVDGDDEQALKAISKNGNVTIQFFRECQYVDISNNWNNKLETYDYNNFWYNNNHYPYDSTILCSNNLTCNLSNNVNYCSAKSCSCTTAASTIETGRIDKGSHSGQKLKETVVDLSDYSFRTETFKILPKSQKPVNSNDLQKIYCSNCGRKLKQKYKFCPFCGTKVN